MGTHKSDTCCCWLKLDVREQDLLADQRQKGQTSPPLITLYDKRKSFRRDSWRFFVIFSKFQVSHLLQISPMNGACPKGESVCRSEEFSALVLLIAGIFGLNQCKCPAVQTVRSILKGCGGLLLEIQVQCNIYNS